MSDASKLALASSESGSAANDIKYCNTCGANDMKYCNACGANDMKYCNRCEQQLPLMNFYLNHDSPDGYNSICKSCN